MKQLRDIIGYILGFVLFVGLMPTLMWLASGRPAFWLEVATKEVVAWGLMLCGLLLSIWTIVYMKHRGKGNPMDAFGHEVAPRTQHLIYIYIKRDNLSGFQILQGCSLYG